MHEVAFCSTPSHPLLANGVHESATEFNVRGDLFAGGTMVGFLRVANAMLAHGAV